MRRVPGWVSREDREPVSLSGSATLADGRAIPVTLSDLSREGCRVQSDESLGIGQEIALDVAPLQGVAGKVRWSLFGTAGIRFTESLNI